MTQIGRGSRNTAGGASTPPREARAPSQIAQKRRKPGALASGTPGCATRVSLEIEGEAYDRPSPLPQAQKTLESKLCSLAVCREAARKKIKGEAYDRPSPLPQAQKTP
jgi:hypothetical protein